MMLIMDTIVNMKSSKHLISVIPLKTPSLGRVADLGEFYYARTDNFIGINLFTNKVPGSLVSSNDNAYTNMKFSMASTLHDKFNELDVDASLQLSFMAGSVKIELGGSAKYLQHNKHSRRSARIALIESINTRFESLSLTDQSLKNLINFDALSRFDVTHILVGIAIDGRDDISTNFVETYDTRDNLWTQISSLNIRRDGLGATVLNDTLYVCGGYISDEQTGTNSCEYFKQESNEWKFLPSMTRKHHYHQLVAHSGYLYSIGGNVNNDDNRASNFVEKYDLANKSWTPVASMINERSSFGSVSFMDKLYVCGGQDASDDTGNALNSCEIYDSISDKWIQMAPMQETRVYMELLKYNDKLYAIGGENLNTFEVYDYKSNSWSHTTLLPTKMWDFGAAVIKEV
ncbi:kelch-like protein 4 [Oppia nitens]|uniref:kelch-like protein 4 n=1 Tax=Oppia nitens TaxID=1686743 RepID=UPI0023DB81AE|nr:kelch-like protein 4 [Oppia nitens]